MSHTEVVCRSCGHDDLKPVLSYGNTPLADRLLTASQRNKPELTAPLDLAFCPECTLVQITETVPPDVLFRNDYPYFSSVSKTLLQHAKENAEALIQSKNLGPNSLVMEVASNDGYLLQNFVAQNIPVQGIDPAQGPAQVATKAGVPTICDFFDKTLANTLKNNGQLADVLIANNVLAHVPDLNGFVEGIATVLKSDGTAVIEAHYVVDMVDQCEFDTIYHQHLCYFSVTALDQLFKRHGLFLNRVERISTYGGSLRVYVEPQENVDASVTELLKEEAKRGIDQLGYYLHFAARAKKIKQDLVAQLHKLKQAGKKIAAYGAAAKATTLLNYCNIDSNLIDYVADINPFKHGRYMGGNHLPIVVPEKLQEDQPDYVLLLAWNYEKEVLQQEQNYRRAGGKFIIPVPHVKIV